MSPRRRAAACVVAAALAAAGCSDTRAPGQVLDQRPIGAGAVTTSMPSVAPSTVPPTTVAPGTAAPTTAAPTTVATTTTTTVATPTTDALPSTIEQVRFGDMAHDLGEDGGGTVALVDGAFLQGEPGGEDFLLARLLDVDLGDLDGDGAAEAAVTLWWTRGGTGQFTDVLVYRWADGAPVLAARAGGGDRAFGGVRRAAIADGVLELDRYDGDAACCPLDVVRQGWRLAGDRLVTTGRARRWAIVFLDRDPATPGDEPVRFRPGTTGAYLAGGVVSSRRGGFSASARQTLRLDVAAPAPGAATVVVDLVRGDEVLGTARPGAPLELVLPASGAYAVEARVDGGPPGDAVLDAELSIT